jgi:hypothetical protein
MLVTFGISKREVEKSSDFSELGRLVENSIRIPNIITDYGLRVFRLGIHYRNEM